MQEEKKTRIQDNRASVYLDPSNKKFLKEYVNAKALSESAAINDALRALKEQIKLKSTYK